MPCVRAARWPSPSRCRRCGRQPGARHGVPAGGSGEGGRRHRGADAAHGRLGVADAAHDRVGVASIRGGRCWAMMVASMLLGRCACESRDCYLACTAARCRQPHPSLLPTRPHTHKHAHSSLIAASTQTAVLLGAEAAAFTALKHAHLKVVAACCFILVCQQTQVAEHTPLMGQGAPGS